LPTWTSKLSIRWILPAAVVLPVLAVALALTLLAYRTCQHSANELAEQSMRQIHGRIESHLEQLMDLPPAMNRLNVTRLRQGLISLDDPARSRTLVFETLQTFPAVSSIVLGSAHGQVMWVIRYPGETSYEYAIKSAPDAMMQEFAMAADGQVGATPRNTYTFDDTKRPWYRAAIDANEPTWGNVYVWVRGGQGVTLGVPYVEPYRDSSGGILGVINCELTLADISAYLSQLEIGKTGLAFIVERDGNLIASSAGIACMKDGTSRLAATDAADARIAAAAGQLPRLFGSLAAVNDVRVGHATIAGEPVQLVLSSYKNRRNLDWLVVTLVPDADFLADVERIRHHSMWIGALASVLALALGVALAIWMLRPILAVVTHARRVGGGEVDARIARHDNREITQLCDALNHMADGLQDRMRLRHALDLAMEVQQTLLPSHTPKIDGLDVAARSKYCDETGGDYYDYLDIEGLGPHSLVIVMGDVTGHGIAAALLMATARGVLRSQARTQGSLGHLLTHLNEHICSDTRGDRFMTMFLAVIDVKTMTMRWASAGHDQPIIHDRQRGLLTEIDETGGGVPLGVVDTEQYEELTYRELHPGQVMLIGTDGLWESKNPADEQFGKERVGQALAELAHLPAAQIEAGIYQRLKQFCDGRPNDDDITYVVVKLTQKTHEAGHA
jgi:serine phosphatase RsbU (regulator of sigma subunit)